MKGNGTMKRLAFALGMLVVAAGVAAAEDNGGFGLGAGIVSVKDSGTSRLWLTANMRWMLADNLALEPEIGWYRMPVTASVNADEFNGGGSVLLILPANKVDLFAGLGLGAHMSRLSSSGGSNTETQLGYHGLAGVDLKASRSISLFGAVRYEIVNSNTDVKTKLWKFYGGLRFRSH